ncbi:MmcQ/YjbR family DNA-binding protein [Nocardioides gilvus]|uniref:MmcQ/YjbR family DNA-binding protein n=1 Tax=Nocardioides gilvus TaxID=1735589 RepID=UPI000D743581|nr:MmcQ/YjbR family DNA-binding protein [Nocardioides gilvus]
MARVQRPEVPLAWVRRIGEVLLALPEVEQEAAWTGVRWRVRGRTVAHVFGGEDQLFRVTFRGEPDEVAAFRHLGDPYFCTGWSSDGIGLVVDGQTDWEEVAELLTDSYCVQAPQQLADQVPRPPG